MCVRLTIDVCFVHTNQLYIYTVMSACDCLSFLFFLYIILVDIARTLFHSPTLNAKEYYLTDNKNRLIIRTNENTIHSLTFHSASTSNGSQRIHHLENRTLRRTFHNKLPVVSLRSLHEVCIGVKPACNGILIPIIVFVMAFVLVSYL